MFIQDDIHGCRSTRERERELIMMRYHDGKQPFLRYTESCRVIRSTFWSLKDFHNSYYDPYLRVVISGGGLW